MPGAEPRLQGGFNMKTAMRTDQGNRAEVYCRVSAKGATVQTSATHSQFECAAID
jgi:hypothetical protein